MLYIYSYNATSGTLPKSTMRALNDAQKIAEWQMATLTKRYYVLRPHRRARGQNEGIF